MKTAKRPINIDIIDIDGHWFTRPDIIELQSIYDLQCKVQYAGFFENVNAISFVNGFGLIFEYDIKIEHLIYSYPEPTSVVLEYLCSGQFFSEADNTELWHYAFVYALKNGCEPFIDKYKTSVEGKRFFKFIHSPKN